MYTPGQQVQGRSGEAIGIANTDLSSPECLAQTKSARRSNDHGSTPSNTSSPVMPE